MFYFLKEKRVAKKQLSFLFLFLGAILMLNLIPLIYASSFGYGSPTPPQLSREAVTGGDTYTNASYTNVSYINATYNDTIWNESATTIYQRDLGKGVSIGATIGADFLSITNATGDTDIGINAGVGNANASLIFRETNVARARIVMTGLGLFLKIISNYNDKVMMDFNLINGNINIPIGNLTTPNYFQGLFNWTGSDGIIFNGAEASLNSSFLNNSISSSINASGVNVSLIYNYTGTGIYNYNNTWLPPYLSNYTANYSTDTGTGKMNSNSTAIGLVSLWSFNNYTQNATGTLVYDELGRNNGTAMNGATWNEGNGTVGMGGYFDGSNDYIVVSDNALLRGMGNLTITGWIKKGTKDVNIVAYYGVGGYHYLLRDLTGALQFYTYNAASAQVGGTFAGIALTANQWDFVAAVYNGTKMLLYLNGVASATTYAQTGLIHNGAGTSLVIGEDYGYATPDDAAHDEIRIYNRSLNTTEISLLYTMSAYSNYTTPIYIQSNSTLNFGNVTLIAQDYLTLSKFYTGDALSLITNIKANALDKSTTVFKEIDHSSLGGIQEIRFGVTGQSIDRSLAVLFKANQQLIEKNNALETEIQRIKDCAKEIDYKTYQICVSK